LSAELQVLEMETLDMRTGMKLLLAVSLLSAPLFAGALALEVGNPAANAEAQAKHAVVLVRTTACHSPEKTEITATAEGLVSGVRRSIPLKVIALSTPGTFVVTREWPSDGTWAVKIVARNPEYKNYATGVLVPFAANSIDWASIQHYFHEPAELEVASLLHGQPDGGRASLK
jgi:hypothetical protein